MAEEKKGMNAEAANFVPAPPSKEKPKPATPPPPVVGVCYDGTDVGALNKEYFFVEAATTQFRTVLPHGHVTCDMYGNVANVSYTSRTGAKTHTVATMDDWAVIQADSAPIYNAFCGFFGWQ
ncbi:MAG: hypothetical protein AAFN27_18225 [Pseudomonadota bacterium]